MLVPSSGIHHYHADCSRRLWCAPRYHPSQEIQLLIRERRPPHWARECKEAERVAYSVQRHPTVSNGMQRHPTLSNSVKRHPTVSNGVSWHPTASNNVPRCGWQRHHPAGAGTRDAGMLADIREQVRASLYITARCCALLRHCAPLRVVVHRYAYVRSSAQLCIVVRTPTGSTAPSHWQCAIPLLLCCANNWSNRPLVIYTDHNPPQNKTADVWALHLFDGYQHPTCCQGGSMNNKPLSTYTLQTTVPTSTVRTLNPIHIKV